MPQASLIFRTLSSFPKKKTSFSFLTNFIKLVDKRSFRANGFSIIFYR